VRREGLSAVDPDRMKQTIEMVAKTFNIPAPDPASVYRPDFLPPRAEFAVAVTGNLDQTSRSLERGLPDDEELVSIEIVRQQLAAIRRDQTMSLVCMPKPKPVS